MTRSFITALLLLTVGLSLAQDSLFVQLAQENMKTFRPTATGFTGAGWTFIQERAKASANVLIGEDHFTVEIPQLITAVGLDTQYDNFYIELDPYSTAIIAKTFEGSDADRQAFNAEFGHLYSFYALKQEYALLEKMMKSGCQLLGSDQIVMYDDRLIFQDLAKKTKNLQAKAIYELVADQSKQHLDKFMQDPSNPMYLMTPAFGEQLTKLEALDLSAREVDIIKKMRTTVEIYQKQSHAIRVQLIKHHLMNDYDQWGTKRNLFKYGANHVARGESFLTVTDIGNIVANISEANYTESFHLMALGESGMQGAPFSTFPASPIDPNGFYLAHLKPFFGITEGADWYVFDLLPLRKALERKKLTIENENLVRTIKGFDALVLIPEVTAAGF